MFEGQSHPDVTAIGSKGLSAKLLLSQSESLFWNGRENRKKKTPLVKDWPAAKKPLQSTHAANKKKIHKLYTVHPPSLCFLYLPHLCIDIPTSPRFIKHADKGLQTQLCLQKRHSLAHSQQISLLPHSSGLYLPTPLRYNGSGPSPPPSL